MYTEEMISKLYDLVCEHERAADCGSDVDKLIAYQAILAYNKSCKLELGAQDMSSNYAVNSTIHIVDYIRSLYE